MGQFLPFVTVCDFSASTTCYAELNGWVRPSTANIYALAAMNNTLRKLSLLGLPPILAITLALMSAHVERLGPDMVSYGNLCGATASDPCYKPALKGGFPVAYLFDAPGVSRERQLAFGEDKLHAGALVANIAVYFAILMLIVGAVWRRRSVAELDAE
ncbi:hypothetical protein [Massilia niastensis]|uniref:hypothetical protein n=1 Tax=Massilia niastensis TaxID=544911 RepID=UPI000361EBF6|nr:hypothetical protein [Massilia niastensis]